MSASSTKRPRAKRRKVGVDDPGGGSSGGGQLSNRAASSIRTDAGVLPAPNDGRKTNDDSDDDDGDGDVMIERESSAWDCLEERFKKNALEGNYLDLTDETAEGGRVVSVAEAGETFAKIRRSNEASVDSDSFGGATSELSEAAAGVGGKSTHPALDRLQKLVRQTIHNLKRARNDLLQTMSLLQSRGSRQNKVSSAKDELKSILTNIGNNTRQIQWYVDANESAVSGDDAAYDTIEKMNLLIAKANALITACNERMVDHCKEGSRRGKKPRPNGRGRDEQDSTVQLGANAYRRSKYSLQRLRDK